MLLHSRQGRHTRNKTVIRRTQDVQIKEKRKLSYQMNTLTSALRRERERLYRIHQSPVARRAAYSKGIKFSRTIIEF